MGDWPLFLVEWAFAFGLVYGLVVALGAINTWRARR